MENDKITVIEERLSVLEQKSAVMFNLVTSDRKQELTDFNKMLQDAKDASLSIVPLVEELVDAAKAEIKSDILRELEVAGKEKNMEDKSTLSLKELAKPI